MKALVLTQYNHFELQDVPEPEVGPEDVLLQVRACGICGSDVHGMDGSTGRRRPPVIMGHEASGVVAAVGARVHEWKPGDRVTFDSTIFCGECGPCRAGRINLCDNRRVLGVSCDEYRQHGAMAERVAVPQHILYRLPDAVSFQRAAMVEPVSIAYHAVHRARIAVNDTAMVVGTGMIGLLVVQMLRLAGCGRIIAVDRDAGRLAVARRLGADDTLQADAVDVPAEVQRLTGGRGADLALEVVGIAPTVQAAVASLRKGGQLVLVGNVSPSRGIAASGCGHSRTDALWVLLFGRRVSGLPRTDRPWSDRRRRAHECHCPAGRRRRLVRTPAPHGSRPDESDPGTVIGFAVSRSCRRRRFPDFWQDLLDTARSGGRQ